jgi:DNA-directed RNA polymerase specialized sigma24 family protein
MWKTPTDSSTKPDVKPPMAEPRKAFVERLLVHRGALQAFFCRRLWTKSDAGDLVQEVYLRMLRVTELRCWWELERLANPGPVESRASCIDTRVR